MVGQIPTIQIKCQLQYRTGNVRQFSWIEEQQKTN